MTNTALEGPKLYKFVKDIKAVKAMLSGSLRFSTVAELNDPTELTEELNEECVRNTLEELRTKGYSDEDYDWLKKQQSLLQILCPSSQAIPLPPSAKKAHELIKSPFYDDIPHLAELQKDVVRKIKSNAGILSLTSNYKSLPMWAHYGNNATGFVVIFDKLHEYFKGDNTGVLDQVCSVEYSNYFEGMTFKPSSQKNLFFWKYLDWSYEEESRVVSSLRNCQKKETDYGEIWVREVEARYVGGVIVGWKVDQQTKQCLLEYCSVLDRQVELFQAKISGVSVELETIPLA